MDSNVRTYDPGKIKLIVSTYEIEGFMDGTFITIAPNGDAFEKLRGGDGGVDRVNKNVRDYSITFTLKNTAISNTVLTGLLDADRASNAGKVPITVKDLNGTSMLIAEQAWIAKEPDVEYADTISGVEWRIDTGIAKSIIGGNLS